MNNQQAASGIFLSAESSRTELNCRLPASHMGLEGIIVSHVAYKKRAMAHCQRR